MARFVVGCADGGHGLPVEAAFEKERTAGVMPEACKQNAGSLELRFEFALQARELLVGEVAVAGGVDQRAAGPRGVIEQCLVPARGRVVDVDGGGGGLDGAEASSPLCP